MLYGWVLCLRDSQRDAALHKATAPIDLLHFQRELFLFIQLGNDYQACQCSNVALNWVKWLNGAIFQSIEEDRTALQSRGRGFLSLIRKMATAAAKPSCYSLCSLFLGDGWIRLIVIYFIIFFILFERNKKQVLDPQEIQRWNRRHETVGSSSHCCFMKGFLSC